MIAVVLPASRSTTMIPTSSWMLPAHIAKRHQCPNQPASFHIILPKVNIKFASFIYAYVSF